MLAADNTLLLVHFPSKIFLDYLKGLYLSYGLALPLALTTYYLLYSHSLLAVSSLPASCTRPGLKSVLTCRSYHIAPFHNTSQWVLAPQNSELLVLTKQLTELLVPHFSLLPSSSLNGIMVLAG